MTTAEKTSACVFCNVERPLIAESKLAIAFYDINPVSPGHALVVPRRHIRTMFHAIPADYTACFNLLREVHAILTAEHDPDGFNVGVNCDEAGGQSVWHAHIHLIPRYAGDVERPLGGIRNVIPWRDGAH